MQVLPPNYSEHYTCDLHTHSTASDGELSPKALMQYAARQKLTHLALTDHDTLAGLSAAAAMQSITGVTLIPGVELSLTWAQQTVHIVGLGVDQNAKTLTALITQIQALREKRAEAICAKLAKIGLDIDWRTIPTQSIGRSHIAMAMVAAGWVKDHAKAFQHYLKAGKRAYVKVHWPALEEGVHAICAAGGIAVLAHPGAYKISHAKMRRLIEDFKAAGGEGIEVITASRMQAGDQSALARARQYDLYASAGSDFHRLSWSWRQLGQLASMPEDVVPIWQAPQLNRYFSESFDNISPIS